MKLRRLLWNFIPMVVLVAVSPPMIGAQPSGESGSRQLIAVDGTVVTPARFNYSYLQELLRTGQNDTPERRQAHLENLVATILLADEARRKGLDQTNDFNEFKNRQHKLAVGARYFQAAVTDSLPPLTEQEARLAFMNSKERVALRHLYFRYPDAARKAYELLENGADFLVLANEIFNTASFDSSAGNLGFASYWELDDAIAEAAFDLEVGSYSPPVQGRYGWHILRVEDRLVNPILTESEFQYRRSGIEAKARIRRNRLAGDRFIREMMDRANVTANPEGIRLAVEAITDAIGRPEQQPAPVSLSESEINFIEATLEPETELMTYTLDGITYSFRAADLHDWLPSLPYVELRDQPRAAMGRALRNEVLAMKGFAADLLTEDDVQETIQFVSNVYLVDLLRETLEPYDPTQIPAETVESAFLRLGFRKLRHAEADWWEIPFASLAQADSALRAIQSEERTPGSYPGFVAHSEADLSEHPLGDYVRRAQLNRPMLACSSDPICFVIQVDRRDLEYTTLEETEGKVRDILSRSLPEIDLLSALRRQARIEVNDVLVDEMLNGRSEESSESQ